MESFVPAVQEIDNPRAVEAVILQSLHNIHEQSMQENGVYQKFFAHGSVVLYRGDFQPKVARWSTMDGKLSAITYAIGIGPINDPNFRPFRYVRVGSEVGNVLTELNDFTFKEATIIRDMVVGLIEARDNEPKILPHLSGDCMSIVGAKE